MALRRSAPRRACSSAPRAAVRAVAGAGPPVFHRHGWPRFVAAVLLACGPAAAEPAAPLPPQRPAALATIVPLPARRPNLRIVPLPPPLPAELAEARAEDAEAAPPETGEAEQEGGSGEAAAPARLASRTAPEAPDTAASSSPASAPLPPGGDGPASAPAGDGAASATLPERCAALVADGTIVAAAEPGMSPSGSCGLRQPVRFSAVYLRDGRRVELRPAAILKCEVVVAVADWLRDDLAPALTAFGAPLDAVKVAASYDCRPRNRVAGARMSEHGLGNALDVGGFELGDRRVLVVEKGGLPQPLRVAMKESACRRFATVLGPGSDGYHEDHVHVDLAVRKADYRICHWNLDAGTAVVAKKDGGAAGGGAPRAPADGPAPAPPPEGAAAKPAPGAAASGAPESGGGGAKGRGLKSSGQNGR